MRPVSCAARSSSAGGGGGGAAAAAECAAAGSAAAAGLNRGDRVRPPAPPAPPASAPPALGGGDPSTQRSPRLSRSGARGAPSPCAGSGTGGGSGGAAAGAGGACSGTASPCRATSVARGAARGRRTRRGAGARGGAAAAARHDAAGPSGGARAPQAQRPCMLRVRPARCSAQAPGGAGRWREARDNDDAISVRVALRARAPDNLRAWVGARVRRARAPVRRSLLGEVFFSGVGAFTTSAALPSRSLATLVGGAAHRDRRAWQPDAAGAGSARAAFEGTL